MELAATNPRKFIEELIKIPGAWNAVAELLNYNLCVKCFVDEADYTCLCCGIKVCYYCSNPQSCEICSDGTLCDNCDPNPLYVYLELRGGGIKVGNGQGTPAGYFTAGHLLCMMNSDESYDIIYRMRIVKAANTIGQAYLNYKRRRAAVDIISGTWERYVMLEKKSGVLYENRYRELMEGCGQSEGCGAT